MKKLKVLLFCAMGMSSSLVVKSVLEAAKSRNIDLDFKSYSSVNFKEQNYDGIDLILLAPQVHNQMEEVKGFLSHTETPVVKVGLREYGMIEGDKILDQILEALDK